MTSMASGVCAGVRPRPGATGVARKRGRVSGRTSAASGLSFVCTKRKTIWLASSEAFYRSTDCAGCFRPTFIQDSFVYLMETFGP